MQWELARALARTERCQFLVDTLDLEAATDIPGAEWEPFQIAHLNDEGLLRIERKSRQIGWSWLAAAEAVANAILVPRASAIFSSINREESAEKIRYAKQITEALHPSFRPQLLNDNTTSMLYPNGSRILSWPQRPVRGRARAWLYLDEFAHYRLDREVYTAGVPVTTKGGRIRIGSTTLGARGMFWEIDQEKVRRYRGYSRAHTPWWKVGALIKEEWQGRLREVSRECLRMRDAPGATEMLVKRFASERILDIFDNMPLDDFEQEYCCAYIDEAMAYIPWGDILACCYDEGLYVVRDGGLEYATGDDPYWLARSPDAALAAVDQMVGAVAAGELSGALCWGLDIGRKKDLTELTILERVEDTHCVRAVFSLDRIAFETQEILCRNVIDRLPIVRGYIDATGMGLQLAEHLHLRSGLGERAMPFIFSQPSKALGATHLKTRFQKGAARPGIALPEGGIRIPSDRDLMYQVHSVRRRVTANNTIVFDVESTERHHADKFWSLVLANEAGETLERIAAYPAAQATILRTTQRLDALVPRQGVAGNEPDLGDAYGFGLTTDQYNALIEQGLAALLGQQLLASAASPSPSPSPSANAVVDADPSPHSDTEHDEDSDHALSPTPSSARATRL